MRYQPTGDQLLDTARNLLREELLPLLPPDKRALALMIANAMSIATRHLQAGALPDEQETAGLHRLLSEQPNDAAGGQTGEGAPLLALNRQLCELIRAGNADKGPFHDDVLQHLLGVARNEVALSNPKYLASAA